jgi:UDP-perosamine 4-acetyltransferase
MVENIIVVGAGGHCKVILSVLRYYKKYSVIGIADRDSSSKGEEISGSIIKFSWNDFKEIYDNGTKYAAIAIGDNKERKELFKELSSIGFKIPTVIHPTALIEKDSLIRNGCLVCMGAKIGVEVHIGENCVIYTGSILDHEVRLEDHVYISPGCSVAGRVTIKEGSFIGIGTSIKEKISIGKNVVVGAGSVVLGDIPDNSTVAGVPAKRIR